MCGRYAITLKHAKSRPGQPAFRDLVVQARSRCLVDDGPECLVARMAA